jgi:tRNA-specific 2-thiouridylase
VVGKDLDHNVLLVAQGNEHPALYSAGLTVAELFWIAGDAPALPLRCSAKVRYRQPDQACSLSLSGDRHRVRFDQPQRAVTPGQSVVFYDGERCLGGGVIERTD